MSTASARTIGRRSVPIGGGVLLCLLAAQAFAGNLGTWERSDATVPELTDDASMLSRALETARRAPDGRTIIPLQDAIDPDTYRLGPGDRLVLGIWGATDLILDVVIAADGTLLVPSVGAIPIAGITLREGAARVKATAAASYAQSEMTLTLANPGLIRVPITGQVASPGIYELAATYRIADLIRLAGGLLPGAQTRAIEIHRDGTAVREIDLLAHFTDGVVADNPPLYAGDRVHVPPAAESYRVRGIFRPTVEIARGSVIDRPFEPQTMRISAKADDDLAFLLRATGAACDAQGVWVMRRDEAPTWIAPDETAGFTLAPGDIVEIPFAREWIAVGGAVTRPGLYPYLPGETVADYVYAAGGPSINGRHSGWRMILADSGRRHDAAPADSVPAGTRIIVPERRSYTLSTYLTPLGTAAALVVSIIALNR